VPDFICQAFELLRKNKPDFAEKLVVVPCDLQLPDLGLDKDSIRLLQDDVNIFFHCAASLRFNEHLRSVGNLANTFDNPNGHARIGVQTLNPKMSVAKVEVRIFVKALFVSHQYYFIR